MSNSSRLPPSYVPTLTEVVHAEAPLPVREPKLPQASPATVDLDALTDRVLEQVMPVLAQRLEERIRQQLLDWANAQAVDLTRDVVHMLDASLEPVVRDALAQSLLQRPGANH